MTEPLNNTRHLTASSPLAMEITAENLLQIEIRRAVHPLRVDGQLTTHTTYRR